MASDDLVIDAAHTVPAHALSWVAARASGPGGQHVNRTESKVHLSLDLNQVYWLVGPVKERLLRLAGKLVDQTGVLTVTSQEHREQHRNLESGRDKLKELLQKALIKPKRRIATKPTKGSIRRRLEDKRRTSLRKADRQQRDED